MLDSGSAMISKKVSGACRSGSFHTAAGVQPTVSKHWMERFKPISHN